MREMMMTNGCIVPIPLQGWERNKDAKAMVERYLDNAAGGGDLRVLLQENPYLETVLLRLAYYLTDRITVPLGEGPNLYEKCLNIAIKEWLFGRTVTRDEPKIVAYYLKGLIAPLPLLLNIKVSIVQAGEQRVWNPTQCELGKWLDGYDHEPKIESGSGVYCGYWNELYPIEFRMLVASRFLLVESDVMRIAARHMDMIVGR